MRYDRSNEQMLENKIQWLLNLKHAEKIQSDGVKLVFVAYVYWVWKARNVKIFEGNELTVDKLHCVIIEEILLKLMGNNYNMKES